MNKINNIIVSLFTASSLFFISSVSEACTRVLYNNGHGSYITGRTMDWKYDIETNLWIFPEGMKKEGATGKDTMHWTSKYGSVVASGYDVSTTDGLNEKGLAANLLWLAESQYPEPKKGDRTLSLSMWAQYILDNYASVDEAIKALEKNPLIVVSKQVPGQERMATVHLSLSDKTGDSAIVEYVNGKQVIYYNKKYTVMTNSPEYGDQLALNAYWKDIGGNVMLPGTNRAADRFVRASYYNNSVEKTTDLNKAVASVFSIMKTVTVPYGMKSEEVNLSSTRWTTVIDHTRELYFFQSATMPNTFWVDLKKFDLSPKMGSVMKLDLGKDQMNIYSGEASKYFKKSDAMKFL